MNAVEIEDAISQLADRAFDPDAFPYAFLEAFGNKETTIKQLKSGSCNASDFEGSVLQRNNIHIAIGAKGKVEASVKAKEVIIVGSIKGNVDAAERITLAPVIAGV